WPMIHRAARARGPRPAEVPSLTATTRTSVVATPASTRIHHAASMPNPTVAPTLTRTPRRVIPPVVRERLLLVLDSDMEPSRPGLHRARHGRGAPARRRHGTALATVSAFHAASQSATVEAEAATPAPPAWHEAHRWTRSRFDRGDRRTREERAPGISEGV